MNILITGGAGFIGSNLAYYHLQKKDIVWAVDNCSSGSKANLPSDPQLRFDQADLTQWKDLEKAVAWADRIYHCAAIVGQKLVLAHPYETLAQNIGLLQHVLESLKEKKKKTTLLITSSSEVYGDQMQFKESDMIHIPSGKYLQTSYPVSKLVNEIMTLGFAHQNVHHVTIVRLFNTTGPRQTGRYGMVVPSFIKQALNNEPLTIYGDGSQTRSFCYIDDVVRAFDLLLNQSTSDRVIVNVGNDEEISILDLAKRVISLSKSKSSFTFVPYKKAYGVDFEDIKRRVPDLTLFRKLTLFEHQWSLDQLLESMIEHHRSFHSH